jgi:hypothetical protein
MRNPLNLAQIRLSPVIAGAISGDPILSGSLWSQTPAMVYVIRRPG